MNIEIAEPGRMTQAGSSLIRLIQNNNMPVLDLLVRESIQNSLDARKKDCEYVEVDFITGIFSNYVLAKEFEKLSEPLEKRYGDKKYEYIAIKDTNTVGLTGIMDYKTVKDNNFGNLLKLVYEICKTQEVEGAGGSWGIGKTVYFRVGIGLVIYYSRIINEQGEFESRLAASLVENETDKNAMIPVYKGMSKRGIAWWGVKVNENETQPVTDEKYINNFLKIFDLEPYLNESTGTTIIIPYIKSEELLSNNRVEYQINQEQSIIPFWGHDLESYLSIAAQRWYAPRLNNTLYRQGAYLKMKINDEGISFNSMEPIFQVIQSLYNRACYIDKDDILSSLEEKKVESIKVTKYLNDQNIGVLAFAKVNREILKMNAPNNKPEPFIYFNNEIRDTEVNKPTICFTRKPAMIVSYENVGAWVSNIPPSSKDEYIIGIFVLNSLNQFKENSPVPNVEEYIRKSEMADHASWTDWSEGNFNPRFVSKIQTKVNKIISREFSQVLVDKQPKINSGLSKMFGDLLLPPEGFGKEAEQQTRESGQGQSQSSRSKFKFNVDSENIRYFSNKMIIPIILETSSKRNIKLAGFNMLIDSESKKIEIGEWEEKMGLVSPFGIKEYIISITSLDGKKISMCETVSANNTFSYEGLIFTSIISKGGTCHGLNITLEEPHYLKMKMEIIVELTRKDVKPSFIFKKEEVTNG